MTNLINFTNDKFGSIRTIEIDGKPYFVANDVAKALGYINPSDATNKHCKHSKMIWGSDSLGRRQQFKIIPEGDLYRLITHSKLPSAEEFESWVFDEVLPSIRKNGCYIDDKSENNVNKYISEVDNAKAEMGLVREIADILNLNDSSKLQLLGNVLNNHNLPSNLLPTYTDSKGILKSATELLKVYSPGISARKFNKIMLDKGLLREVERKSTKDNTKIKKFKNLVNTEFGENQVNPNNPKETQPMYYEEKFEELLKELEIK